MALIPHLYLHIPFCHRICPYCSFYKHQPGATDQGKFLQAVVAEARLQREKLGENLAIKTIYWGGGTPSMLSVRHLESFLPAFLEALGHPQLDEWTVEMNPRTLTPEKLALLKQHGVTRASLGVQAWDAATLATLGRDHSPADAEEAIDALREAGFPVLSIDLMFSVPGQPLAQWIAGLEKTHHLGPDHISCYNLTYEEDTDYFSRFQRGEYQRDDATDRAFFTETMDRLGNAGFVHYEISNFARPGCASVHNAGYWAGADYLGLGPSAVSTICRTRSKNVEDTAQYVQLLERGWSAAAQAESLTEEQWRCERIALELRTSRGLSIEMLGSAVDKLPRLVEAGYVVQQGGRIILTRDGMLIADSVIEHLWV